MGRRSAAESVIAILTAFIERRTWRQAHLARRVGITPAQVRKQLLELERHGVPLESEHDHPHVVWSVPHRWFPGGVTITAEDAHEVLRQLARGPANKDRDRLLLNIAGASRVTPPSGIVTADIDQREEAHLRLVEDALTRNLCLHLRYTSTQQGVTRDRVVSVQRILSGPVPRFIAHCHQVGELRSFRVSRIQHARLEPDNTFIAAPVSDVDAMIASSVDGYLDPIEPVLVAFTVREPELRWVADTTPIPMHAEPTPDGLRLSATTSGVRALARFVVGLGEAARAETPELLAAVHRLAQGALAANSPPIRSATAIRSTDYETDIP